MSIISDIEHLIRLDMRAMRLSLSISEVTTPGARYRYRAHMGPMTVHEFETLDQVESWLNEALSIVEAR